MHVWVQDILGSSPSDVTKIINMKERKLSKMGKALAGGIVIGTLMGCGLSCLFSSAMGNECKGVIAMSLLGSTTTLLFLYIAIVIGKIKNN